MTKKVNFGAKPVSASGKTQSKIDQWVDFSEITPPEREQLPPIKTKRFTMDIPGDLHARIKSQCAMRGVTMHDEVIALLEKHFPANG